MWPHFLCCPSCSRPPSCSGGYKKKDRTSETVPTTVLRLAALSETDETVTKEKVAIKNFRKIQKQGKRKCDCARASAACPAARAARAGGGRGRGGRGPHARPHPAAAPLPAREVPPHPAGDQPQNESGHLAASRQLIVQFIDIYLFNKDADADNYTHLLTLKTCN